MATEQRDRLNFQTTFPKFRLENFPNNVAVSTKVQRVIQILFRRSYSNSHSCPVLPAWPCTTLNSSFIAQTTMRFPMMCSLVWFGLVRGFSKIHCCSSFEWRWAKKTRPHVSVVLFCVYSGCLSLVCANMRRIFNCSLFHFLSSGHCISLLHTEPAKSCPHVR